MGFTRLFHRYREITGRLLYVFPQKHVNGPNRKRHSIFQPDIKLYHQYAKDILACLEKDGINPKDCIIYLENVEQNISPKGIRKFITEGAPNKFPDDLLTTLVLPLFRKGAVVRGAENSELLNRLGDEKAGTQQGVDERDIKMRSFIGGDLLKGKVGIFLVGAHHNFQELRNYFSKETDIELRTDSSLYQKYQEGAPLRLPDSTRGRGLG